MDFIFIDALRVDACVGIYPRERGVPQPLELNLTFGVPDAAAAHDDIADTIDYAEVIARLQQVLSTRSFNLIETLGEFVVSVLFDEFSAPWVKLSIAKIGVVKGVKRVGVYIQRANPKYGFAAEGIPPWVGILPGSGQ